jgi:hypothetical protein
MEQPLGGLAHARHHHLGQALEGRAALAQYRALASASVDEFAAEFFRRASDRKLVEDGIALTEDEGRPRDQTQRAG